MLTVPTLILHGDDDQVVPIEESSILSVKLIRTSILKVYEGFPHGMCTTHVDKINSDLDAFITSHHTNIYKHKYKSEFVTENIRRFKQ
jgi:non-heme chloroperoxidase